MLLAGACGADSPEQGDNTTGSPPAVAPPAPSGGNAGGSAPALGPMAGSTSTAPTPAAGAAAPSQPAMNEPTTTMMDEPTVPMGMAADPNTPFSMLPKECVGFEVAGLEYSPGGDVLPNKCAPFNSMRNNPYAIRCIDADPTFKTKYPGDEYCILPPDPKNGTQVHMAPKNYDDPEPGFVMHPGEEVTDWYYTKTPNTEEHFFFRVNIRMRAGSHHMINRLLDAAQPDGFQAFGELSFGSGPGSRSFPGAQRPDSDRPQGTLEVPPENAGLGDKLLTNQQFSLNLHHFNFGDRDVLREVWINLWYMDQSQVKQTIQSIAGFGNPLDVTIGPGQSANLEYQCPVTGNSRIITLNGHRHTHTTRFGVWLVKQGGEKVSLYESFHYDDMPTFQYDSVSMNPVADPATKQDGAFTGILNVGPGDTIHFECDVNNTSQNTLRFANEVETGEMCILFGTRVGAGICEAPTRVQ